MTFVNIITGLIIAAVLHVPGTTQHETTQVGEEHNVVIEKEVRLENLFHYSGANDLDDQIQDPTNWGELNAGPLPCAETSGLVCVVKFDGDLAALRTYVSTRTITDIESANMIEAYQEP